ncbi:hypothetical protein [Microbacterium sp.]|uniref:hypothetical protein n=1 Tax=Microbacterium sp. TaxID=51671 RepID=UPI003C76B9B6
MTKTLIDIDDALLARHAPHRGDHEEGRCRRRSLDANARANVFLQVDAEVAEIALDLQSRLFAAGLGRAVGVKDLQIAATAIRHTRGECVVSVVHYDGEFEQLTEVAPWTDSIRPWRSAASAVFG